MDKKIYMGSAHIHRRTFLFQITNSVRSIKQCTLLLEENSEVLIELDEISEVVRMWIKRLRTVLVREIGPGGAVG